MIILCIKLGLSSDMKNRIDMSWKADEEQRSLFTTSARRKIGRKILHLKMNFKSNNRL